MSTERNFTIAQLVMVLIFFVGIIVRVFELGAHPLSDFEASAALEAIAFATRSGETGVQSGYAALTGLVFFLFGDTNFTARIIPAIAGSMLVLVPFVFRKKLGVIPALVLGTGLALDPLHVNVSRLAGGPSLAVGLLLMAAALRIAGSDAATRNKWLVPAVVLFGLALLSGPAVFFGLLTIGFSYAAVRAFGSTIDSGAPGEEGEVSGVNWIAAGVAFVLTVVLVSTGFMISPQGLAYFAGSLPAFLFSWVEPSMASVWQVLIVLFGYQLLPLIFAIICVFRSWRTGEQTGKVLSVWFVSSLLLIMLFPGRQVSDLIWISVPLWSLAALEIGRDRYWNYRPFYRPLLLASALVVFLISFWTNITSLSYVVPDDPQYNLRLLIIAGTLILGGLSISLVSLGWGKHPAAAGTVWGLMIILAFGLLSGNWGTSHRGIVEVREPWMPVPGAGEAALLDATLDSLGDWFNGSSRGLVIRFEVDSPAMKWALRDYKNAKEGLVASADDLPDVVITGQDTTEVHLSSGYRGQALTWRVYPSWAELDRIQWLQWLLFREAPAFNESVIVWVRADLFLAYENETFTDLYPLDAIDEPPDEDYIPLEDLEGLFPEE